MQTRKLSTSKRGPSVASGWTQVNWMRRLAAVRDKVALSLPCTFFSGSIASAAVFNIVWIGEWKALKSSWKQIISHVSDNARYTKRRSMNLWKANRAFKVDGVRRLSVTMMCMLTDNIIGIFDILRTCRLELHMCSCVTTLFLLYYITMFTVAYLSRYNLHAHVCFSVSS